MVKLHTIVVRETASRRGKFEARLPDGRVLVASSRTPFCTAARVLVSEGCDLEDTIQMVREIGGTVALTGILGEVAKLTVHERDRAKPTFVRFEANLPTGEPSRIAPVTVEGILG
jgi:hypothetical protein